MQGYSALKSLEVCLHPFFLILPLMLSGSMHLSFVANYQQDFSAGLYKKIPNMLTSSFSKKILSFKGTVPRDFQSDIVPVIDLYLRISLRIFEKIRNNPTVIFRGLGEEDLRKNLKQKIL
jgi:hypothetical protein